MYSIFQHFTSYIGCEISINQYPDITPCHTALTTRGVQDPPRDNIITLISYILKKNNFVFGDKHHLQIHGTAMGTCMAPYYANIFMAQLEQSLLARPSTLKPSVWWHYIDDIFAIWSHGIEAFVVFLNDLNEAHSITGEWSYSSISFLSTCVTLEGGITSTSLHHKSTDTHQYVAAKSRHPRHCKAAIPYIQALRIRRICSSDHNICKNTNELHCHLVYCGYNPSLYNNKLTGLV